MRGELGWNYVQSGWLKTANAIGYLIGASLSRLVIRHTSNRRLFIVGVLLTALAVLGTEFTHDIFWLGFWRMLSGVTGAAAFIGGGALSANVVPNLKWLRARRRFISPAAASDLFCAAWRFRYCLRRGNRRGDRGLVRVRRRQFGRSRAMAPSIANVATGANDGGSDRAAGGGHIATAVASGKRVAVRLGGVIRHINVEYSQLSDQSCQSRAAETSLGLGGGHHGAGATVHRRPLRYYSFSGNVVADARMVA